jgi:hypothetical protein
MKEVIQIIREDIKKAKARLEAFEQEDNKEAIAFNKGQITALKTVLFDIKINNLTTK